MKAIYRGRLAHVTDETGAGVVLDGDLFVGYEDSGLIVDPNDDQVAAAEAGSTIPMDPDEGAELEAILRSAPVSEDTIQSVLSEWARARPVDIQRRENRS